MHDCCDAKTDELARLRGAQGRVLRIVLAINAAMFLVEFGGGLLARSTSLLADSLDMLGDAFVYGVTLWALDRGPRWRAGTSLLKGGIITVSGLGIAGEAVVKASRGDVPDGAVMGVFGVAALAANVVCLVLLMRHRQDDLAMRSTWLCSRNDVLANLGVLAAAIGVVWTGSALPDLVVGFGICAVVTASGLGVIRAARSTLASTPG